MKQDKKICESPKEEGEEKIPENAGKAGIEAKPRHRPGERRAPEARFSAALEPPMPFIETYAVPEDPGRETARTRTAPRRGPLRLVDDVGEKGGSR